MQFWLIQTMNGLAFGSLLFLLASGFSLIFGLMRIVNLTHGAYFLLGAYIGLTVVLRTGSFWLAAAAAGAAVATLGVLIERFLLQRLHGQALPQVLLTLGLAFIVADGVLWIWGGDPRPIPAPRFLSGSFTLAGATFPAYRGFVFLLGLAMALLLWLLQERTRLGAMIRAGVDDQEVARALGIPVHRIFTLVFAFGAFLAALGGILGGPILGAYPGLDADVLPLALVVVILGGMGSLGGALLGSFLIGFLHNFGQALFPDFAYFTLFLPMVLILAFRPSGLFGRW